MELSELFALVDRLRTEREEERRAIINIDLLPHIKLWQGHWIWTGTRGPEGYGQVRIHGRGRADSVKVVSRLMLCLFTGQPYGLDMYEAEHGRKLFACHVYSCGIRACCNPEHLYFGTHQTNIANREMARVKGRPVEPTDGELMECPPPDILGLLESEDYRDINITRGPIVYPRDSSVLSPSIVENQKPLYPVITVSGDNCIR